VSNVCRTHHKLFGLAALLATSALAGTPALAQTAAPAATTPASQPVEIGEIIVTAQKREERASVTPLSLSVVSGASLEKTGATQLVDFAATVPGLTFTSAGVGQGQVNLRGITTGPAVSPTVGIYVDEVPYGSSSFAGGSAQLALDVGLFDIDRVEILRGPQGTLYGASTMGGLLKYVTKTPDTTQAEGAIRAGLSAIHDGKLGYNAAAMVNTPFAGDKAAVRLSGFYTQEGGYVDNLQSGQDDINESKVYGGRVDVAIKPTDALSVRLTGFSQHIEHDGLGSVDFDSVTLKPVDGKYDQRRFGEPYSQDFRLASGVVGYDFGGAQLTSITSYQKSTVQNTLDLSPLYVPLLGAAGLDLGSTVLAKDMITKKFTQEVRLAGSVANVDWIGGVFYTHEDSFQRQVVDGTTPTGAPFPLVLADVQLPSLYKEKAVFGTVTWHLTDRLDLAGGARYASNDQTYEQIGDGLLISSTPKRSATESVTTWLANARYKFNDHSMVYLRYATGYRPGGPNAVANDPLTGLPLADPTYQSDSIKSYEAGYKASTADRRFSIDANIYHIDWNNLQIIATRNAVGVVANVQGAKVDGAEITLTARPATGLTLVAALGVNNARLAADTPDLGGKKGEGLPDSPDVTLALAADYGFSVQDREVDVGATVRFVGDRASSFDQSVGNPQHALPDYTTVDLRAGMDFGTVRAQLYLRNLFDKFAELSASTAVSPAGGPTQITPLAPRTIGLNLTKRF
jgi:outer membrane receptor protein involved in Fe transport